MACRSGAGPQHFSVAVLLLLTACSRPAPLSESKAAPKADPPRITQFYTGSPQIARGENALLCYGVEHATAVSLSPPPQELTASPTRCVEVTPQSTTTYSLTATGAAGPPAKQELTVTVGPPRVKIIEVQVSSVNIKAGDLISICYNVQNAKTAEIQPIGFRGPAGVSRACTTDTPRKTTTYVVSATGAGGDHDQEKVTVQVR